MNVALITIIGLFYLLGEKPDVTQDSCLQYMP